MPLTIEFELGIFCRRDDFTKGDVLQYVQDAISHTVKLNGDRHYKSKNCNRKTINVCCDIFPGRCM